MKDESTNQTGPLNFDAEFARVFDERIAAQTPDRISDDFAATARHIVGDRFQYAPHQRAVDLGRQKLHEENSRLANENAQLRRTIRDRERMIWFAVAAWLVLLAMVLLAR